MDERKRRRAHWLRDFLCGALIGAGAILPGVSGGVLAVVFDIYRPFMEVLTRPRRAVPKYWKMLIPLGLGWAAGFMGFAKGISAAIALSAAATTWLFIGLIAGTAPSLFREAGKEGRSASAWGSFLLCAAAVFAGLFYVSRVVRVQVEPSFWWYNFCGALWGMGVVIPGMTSSSVMMALGLYQPMLEGLARLDFLVLAAAHRLACKAGDLVLPAALRRGLPRHPGLRDGLHPGHRTHGVCRGGGDGPLRPLRRRRVRPGLFPGADGQAGGGMKRGLREDALSRPAFRLSAVQTRTHCGPDRKSASSNAKRSTRPGAPPCPVPAKTM